MHVCQLLQRIYYFGRILFAEAIALVIIGKLLLLKLVEQHTYLHVPLKCSPTVMHIRSQSFIFFSADFGPIKQFIASHGCVISVVEAGGLPITILWSKSFSNMAGSLYISF